MEPSSLMRFFTEHWAAFAVVLGLAAVAWGLLGRPGMPPNEIDQHVVRAEVEGALWKGEPSLLSQLGTRCGDAQWAVRPSKADIALSQLELDAMPFVGERSAQGRVVLELRTPKKTCRFRGTFRYAFTSKPIGSSSIPHQHRSYTRQAIVSALTFEPAE